MSENSDDRVAEQLVAYHRLVMDADSVLRRGGDSDVIATVLDLVCTNPHRCWSIVSLAASKQPTEDALSFLGMTVSRLLREHPQLISTITRDVDSHPELRELMSWVLEDTEIDHDVWQQVESLS